MPNTTNFGWATPADTDLVKDGAAAIRTLGSSIDTSLVDLKGGTTGQVLTKASNTDLDFSFTTPAGSPITTEGDLIIGDASGDAVRLPIGSAGTVLTSDGDTAEWAAPSAASFVGCILQSTNAQSLSNNVSTQATWDNEIIDTDGFHSTVSNTDRITIPAGKGGKYLVYATGAYAANATGNRQLFIYNTGTGSLSQFREVAAASANTTQLTIMAVGDLSVGDYVSVELKQNSAGSLNFGGGNASQFGAIFLGA
jgi:hypothetical protein